MATLHCISISDRRCAIHQKNYVFTFQCFFELFCKKVKKVKKKKTSPLPFFWVFQLFKKVAYFLKVNLFKKHKKVQKGTIKIQNFVMFPGKIVKKY